MYTALSFNFDFGPNFVVFIPEKYEKINWNKDKSLPTRINLCHLSLGLLWPFYRGKKASEDHGILWPFRDRNRVLLEQKKIRDHWPTWHILCLRDNRFRISILIYMEYLSPTLVGTWITPFENPQRWMGQNAFPILLLNDDNMIKVS